MRGLIDNVMGFVRRMIALALRLRIVRAYLLYGEHRGPMLADSITYRTLFSVFAGVLLCFSFAALWIGGDPEAMQALSDALDSAIPGLTDIVKPESIAPVAFTLVGIASLFGLVGAAMSAIDSMRKAMRILADDVTEDGSFVWVLLRNLLVALGFGCLLVISAVLSTSAAIGLSQFAEWLGLGEIAGATELLARLLGIVGVFVIDMLALVMLFRVLSGVKAPSKALWGGAAIGGIGLTVLQELSGLFVRGATANPLLATFAALIALLLWFNLSAQVILISSAWIITATAQANDRVRAKYGAETLAQRRRLRAEEKVWAATRELRAAREAEEAEAAAAAAALDTASASS